MEKAKEYYATGVRLMAEIDCKATYAEDPERVEKRIYEIATEAEKDEALANKIFEFGRDCEMLLGAGLDYKTRVAYETGLTLVCLGKLGAAGGDDDTIKQAMWEELFSSRRSVCIHSEYGRVGRQCRSLNNTIIQSGETNELER
ncbi:MAG: hypothetical protein ACLP4V_22305 [Methylocella sp.]